MSFAGLILIAASFAAAAGNDAWPDAPIYHLSAAERAAIDEAWRRGAAWLVAQQDGGGQFPPALERNACPLALTVMALWALADGAPAESALQASVRSALAAILARRQPDGGIYDARHGLAVYTSGVAAQALRACLAWEPNPAAQAALTAVESFLRGKQAPESLAERPAEASAARAGRRGQIESLAAGSSLLPEAERAALEFLRAAHGDGAGSLPAALRGGGPRRRGGAKLTYEDMLPLVYEPLDPRDERVRRALDAIQRCYTLDRNPDLTRRYGPGGFQPGTQGLFYYYLVLARTLALQRLPVLATPRGPRTDWVRELRDKLLARQAPTGSWAPVDPRWWEGEPVLVTAYSLLTLRLCRDMPAGGAPPDDALDAARRRGAAWLEARQSPDGDFVGASEARDNPVLCTAVALWALSRAPADVDEGQLLRGCAVLFRHRQPDGGIYSRESAHQVLEAEAARQALASVVARVPSDQIERFLGELDRYLEQERRRAVQEASSVAPARAPPAGSTLPAAEARAVEFLNRIRRPEDARASIADDDRVPPGVFAVWRAENTAVRQACELLRRTEPAGSRPTAVLALFPASRWVPRGEASTFACLLAARVLETCRSPATAEAAALIAELLGAQRADGSWSNDGPDSPRTAMCETAYAILALAIYRQLEPAE
jgi:hypothetical protein